MPAIGGEPTYIAAATAADVDRFVADVDQKVGAYTVINSGAMPTGGAYLITATVTATDTADTPGTLVLVGTDLQDTVQTETLTLAVGSTVSSTKYFKTLTSATGAGWVIDAAEGSEDRITVGCGASACCHFGDGVLLRVIVSETAAGAITFADATGTLAVIKASVAEMGFELGVNFKSYLTVTTAAASKVTVVTA